MKDCVSSAVVVKLCTLGSVMVPVLRWYKGISIIL